MYNIVPRLKNIDLSYLLLLALLITTAALEERALFIGYFLAFGVIFIIKNTKKRKINIVVLTAITALVTFFLTFAVKVE